MRPTGTVTFLFTDIERSTQHWEKFPDAMSRAFKRHEQIIRDMVAARGGYTYKMVGDAFQIAFAMAPDALNAALDVQRALYAENWGELGAIRVRMVLHTGVTEERGDDQGHLGDYVGPTLNRAARIIAAGHGGQILLSQTTYDLVRDLSLDGAAIRDLGEHHLRDLIRPEHIYQLVATDLPSDFPPLKTLAVHLHNLPAPLTSFIGREREKAEVERLLNATRLLTLTGSGGAGKTRLALEVAGDLVDAECFRNGVWLVDLAALSDPGLVPQAVASALGVREEQSRAIRQTLTDYLEPKNLLLILDNCEHLIDACARLADALLRDCPQLKILATSREALGITGESTFRVPSLASPDPENLPPLEMLLQYEAVHLFADRARAVQSAFQLTNANAPAIAQICRRLDGIPLAIELAAARVRGLPVEEIATKLDDRFQLLTSGSRTALPRQQTLRALIDWSYDLLSDAERGLLQRLSVFAGGWTLEAAEFVCVEERGRTGAEEKRFSPALPSTLAPLLNEDVLDLLTGLVDKSLVVMDQSGEDARYRLLETIRQYAQEKLSQAGDETEVRTKHLNFFVALAEDAERHLIGEKQKIFFDRLEKEHDNFRAALDWSLKSDTEAGLRLAGELGTHMHLWELRGYLSEGRQWLHKLLMKNMGESRPTQAKALSAAGTLAQVQGDYAAANIHSQASLEIFQELGERSGMATALTDLGHVARLQGEYDKARALFEQSLSTWTAIDDKRGIAESLDRLAGIAWVNGDYQEARSFSEKSLAICRETGDKQGITASLNSLGNVADALGEFDKAIVLYEESIKISKEIGYRRGVALALNNLGLIFIKRGDYERARNLFEEGLAIRRDLGVKLGFVYSLENFAILATALDHAARAARLFGAARALREAIGSPLSSGERYDYDRSVAKLCAMLGNDAFAGAWAEGRAMTLEQAIEYALEEEKVA